MKQQTLVGFGLTLVSAFLFAAAGPVAKAMYATGWTPGSVVLLRLLGCAVLLALPTVLAMRGRWSEVRTHWRMLLVYGVVAMAGVQGLFFMAVEHLTVAVALLLEMTAPLMIVFWVWLRTKARPSLLTFIGMAVSMSGLVLVLDPRGAQLHLGGVLMALGAAVCLCAYFLVGAKTDIQIPAVAMTGIGMGIGAGVILALWPTGLLDYEFRTADIALGEISVPWYVGVFLIVMATGGAYLTGIAGIRLIGATVSSFVNLIEVPFSVVVAWLVLAELPVLMQLAGGVLVLGGVGFIKLGANRSPAREVLVDDEAAGDSAVRDCAAAEPLDTAAAALPVGAGEAARSA
ncbi:EamA family transporter [Brevibacterium daeguense]|uniref:EamA family transporter n=1 Tax=Brevibacterium daeguense TaxID=909936 RepID=UPI001F1B16AF